MTLLFNFAHPLTDEQRSQVVALLGESLEERIIAIDVDRTRRMADVAQELADQAGLSSVEWQSLSLLINPPGLAPLAVALIAELHGRCGYFPSILNVRPILDSTATRFEIAEIVNLQALRDQARMSRHRS